MDHAATVRRFYELINAGDIDAFGELLAGDFVEHEVTPGLAPTKEGVLQFFRMNRAAFPDMRLTAQEVLTSGDDGLAHEHWGVMDALAMMQQLGAVPSGPPA